MLPRQLNIEEQHLLERAKANGYVTMDRRDEFDVVAAAYRDWCRAEKMPYFEIAIGDATSRVTYSLLEADAIFSEEVETRLRRQLANYCLYDGEIVIEDDYCIAERVLNDQLPALLAWLRTALNQAFPVFL